MVLSKGENEESNINELKKDVSELKGDVSEIKISQTVLEKEVRGSIGDIKKAQIRFDEKQDKLIEIFTETKVLVSEFRNLKENTLRFEDEIRERVSQLDKKVDIKTDDLNKKVDKKADSTDTKDDVKENRALSVTLIILGVQVGIEIIKFLGNKILHG